MYKNFKFNFVWEKGGIFEESLVPMKKFEFLALSKKPFTFK